MGAIDQLASMSEMRTTRKCGRQHTDMTSDPQPQSNACAARLTVNDS